MSTQSWIQAALLGLLMVHSAASQLCSFRFGNWSGSFCIWIPVQRFSAEILHRDHVHFTAEEVNQGMRNAMQHFNSQFGLDFSNVGPDDTNQRFLRNEAFGLYRVPFNETIVTNHWIVTGNRKSTCFPMSRVYNSSIIQQCYMGCIVVKQDNQLLQTIICYMAILWFLVPVLSSQFWSRHRLMHFTILQVIFHHLCNKSNLLQLALVCSS